MHILLGTFGCIGAGLDSNKVKFVSQEGVRCGRDLNERNKQYKNRFELVFNLNDFVTLN